MKKPNPPKPKEYAAQPFAALKAVKPALAEAAPPPPPKPVVQPPVEEDGDMLFLRAMTEVRPMRAPQRSAVTKAGTATPTLSLAAQLTAVEKQEFLSALKQLRLDVSFRESLPGAADKNRPKGINRLDQLKRGTIRLDYELDLHGLTKEEALESLAQFVASAVRRQQKAVLVITGQGFNSPGVPVLQGAVAAWLREHGRDLVAEFAPAPGDMGGAGAYVVFLKKQTLVGSK
jgi:DNA-nicking Smr family endonuclease